MSLCLHDVVILGTAVPEQIRDGRKTVCVAAWQKDMGLIRLYPCRANSDWLARWSIIDVHVERNSKDTRRESFKIVGSHENWEGFSDASVQCKGHINARKGREILDQLQVGCVADVNAQRDSLCVVTPASIQYRLAQNPTYGKPINKLLIEFPGESWLSTKSDFPFQPRIQFHCSKTCTTYHDMTVVEWGAFEWIRKHPNPETAMQLFNNWRLADPDYEVALLLGNQAQHRNSFIVISVLPAKKRAGIPSREVSYQADFLELAA